MTYTYILPIVAGVVLVLAGGYEINNMVNYKSVFKSGIPDYNDRYLRDMEEELNRRPSDSRRTVFAGSKTRRRNK